MNKKDNNFYKYIYLIINKNILKSKFYLIILKVFFQFTLLFFVFIILSKINILKYKSSHNINLLYKKKTFVVISRYCKSCGFFADYNIYLGCLNYFFSKGYIPIIDQISYPNYYNKFKRNLMIDNPWEIFFNQMYGLKLKEVLKKAKKIKFDTSYLKKIKEKKFLLKINFLIVIYELDKFLNANRKISHILVIFIKIKLPFCFGIISIKDIFLLKKK